MYIDPFQVSTGTVFRSLPGVFPCRTQKRCDIGGALKPSALRRLNNKISSLIALAQKGVKLEEILKRIKQLESERSIVEVKVGHLTYPKPARMQVTKALDETVAFFDRFTQAFNGAPISERKSLVRQIVHRIAIDRDRRVATCYLPAMQRSAEKIVE